MLKLRSLCRSVCNIPGALHYYLLQPIARTASAAVKRVIMFVLQKDALPADPVFPANLKQLGYFVNKNDQIRMISHPEEKFLYKINANERYNELQKEAMNSCIRDIVVSRLHEQGLETLRLPIGAKPNEQHVPILVSRSLQTDHRVIVVFGEPVQDLGIWAYRTIGNEKINAGSAVDFAAAVLRNKNITVPDTDQQLENSIGGSPVPGDSTTANDEVDKNTSPGLILTNPGQLVWYCAGERAISLPTWLALPRKTAVEPPMKMSSRNKIPGNETWQDHVTYVFNEVLDKLTSSEAKIDIVGLAEGGLAAVRYLSEHWSKWESRISSIVLGNPLHDVNHLHPAEFAEFVSTRCRAYLISNAELDQPVAGRYEFGCNCYSSGEPKNVECIIPQAYNSMLKWLDHMAENPGLKEVEVIISDEIGLSESVGNAEARDNDEGVTEELN